MDLRDRTKAHYDAHAATVVSLSDRARGQAGPLKKFHNAVKRSLIQTCVGANKGSSLLDLATGRGGDLRKWMDAGVRFVKGLDISEVELQEARRRYTELAPRTMDCVFEATPCLGEHLWKDPTVTYDAVTCMFALHYFFGSERSLKTVLKTVVANLKVGGYFFGIVPDGRRINEYMMRCGQQGPFFKVRPLWTGPPQAFGSAYSFEIADTVTQGAPLEFLVYENVLCQLAKTVGLHPVLDIEVEGTMGTPDSLFKHLQPPYNGEPFEASQLYAAFVFKKI